MRYPNNTDESVFVKTLMDKLTYACWKYNVFHCDMPIESARRLFRDAVTYEELYKEELCQQ